MIVSDKKLVETVHEMQDEWSRIIDEKGELPYSDMIRTLRFAQEKQGKDVVAPRKESTLERMQLYLVGELVYEHGVLH